MKICIDLTSLADNFSGIERYALNISKNLIKYRTENEYLLIFKREIHKAFLQEAELPNVSTVVLKPCKKLFFNLFRLPKELKRHKVDKYLFPAFPMPLFFNRRNSIVTIHDLCCFDVPETMTAKSRLYFKKCIKHTVRRCEKIVTVSNFSKGRIIEKFKVGEERVILAHCGIDKTFLNSAYTGRNSETDKKYGLPEDFILSLSTLEPRKNLDLLIKAYSDMVEKNLPVPDLVLAGRMGWKLDKLLEGIGDKVKNRIRFTGFIEDCDLPYVYQRANVFVFPSKYEGFGLPPLEAMACGALVLSSDASSLPEVLGDAAIYFESDNAASLAEGLTRVLSLKPEDALKYREAGKITANKFNWDKEALKII